MNLSKTGFVDDSIIHTVVCIVYVTGPTERRAFVTQNSRTRSCLTAGWKVLDVDLDLY